MKKKLLSFLLALVILLPIVVRAEGETNTLVGPELSSPGAEISYDITFSSEEIAIKGYNATLTYESDVLELLSIENSKNWKNSKGSNKLGNSPLDLSFKHVDDDNVETGIIAKNEKVATVKFKVKKDSTKSETTITLGGSLIGDSNDQTVTNMIPTPENPKVVAIRSTDNTLKDLKLNGKTVVNFSPSTYSYSIQVEQETTTANIEATTNSSQATFVDKYGPRSVGLDYGDNVIEVKVVSAAGEEKTYVIKINRLDNRGTNNNLKEVILNSGKVKINFEKSNLSYKVKTYKLTSIDVKATAEDTKATVKIEKPDNLQIGENPINIIVTSEDGRPKTYTIVLDNLNRDIDTTLKNIEIFGLDSDFTYDKNVYDYEIVYKPQYKNKLVFKYELNNEEDKDSVQIDEPLLEKTKSNLKEGSIVKIRVYATNGTESLYTITFVPDKRVNFFFLLFIVIFVVLLIVFIKLMIDNKKRKNLVETDDDTIIESEEELVKTKRMNKINLE